MGVDGVRFSRDRLQRISVGWRARDRGRADVSVRPYAILNDYRLPEL